MAGNHPILQHILLESHGLQHALHIPLLNNRLITADDRSQAILCRIRRHQIPQHPPPTPLPSLQPGHGGGAGAHGGLVDTHLLAEGLGVDAQGVEAGVEGGGEGGMGGEEAVEGTLHLEGRRGGALALVSVRR